MSPDLKSNFLRSTAYITTIFKAAIAILGVLQMVAGLIIVIGRRTGCLPKKLRHTPQILNEQLTQMTPERYQELRSEVISAGYGDEIKWAQTVKAPDNADDFAGEVIWVILCSGMKEQVARLIQERVWNAIRAGKTVKGNVLGKSGKADAIDRIWRDREKIFGTFKMANDKIGFCASLPWIGDITKYHLAKSLGVDCAKPDVHLERIAKFYKTTTAALCGGLAASTGDRIATVDLVIWRACNLGIIKSRELNP